MKKNLTRSLIVFAITTLIVSACAPQPVQVKMAEPLTSSLPQSASQPTQAAPVQSVQSSNDSSGAPHVDVLDVTHLPLGDGKVSSIPERGYVFSCMTQFNGRGAQGTGPWMNGDGTWDLTKKLTVDGSVSWPHSFTITVNGDQRTFTGNDLPNHPTGNFPISPSDDAYSVDRNPNSIKSQSISFSVPANPTAAAQPTCVGGEIGIMLSGALIFSAFDAEGHDAVAHEVQDQCGGHPQESGYYHYHNLSNCIEDNATGQSALLGYAFDGFGIYGPYDANGKELTNADLDECHGITSEVEWNGQRVVMYHYVATREFPYVIGCFRGTPSVRALTARGGGQGPNGQQPGGQQFNGQSQSGPQGGQPPLEATNACANLTQNAACSFSTLDGQTVSGTCQTPPQLMQLVCVPAGGPPAGP